VLEANKKSEEAVPRAWRKRSDLVEARKAKQPKEKQSGLRTVSSAWFKK